MKIVLASNNENKLTELSALCQALSAEIVPQKHFHIPSIEETGLTFIENAILKARHACQHSNLAAIADDSGLEVDALNGNPGIHSARYADAKLGSQAYCDRLLHELAHIPLEKRTARYRCVLVFLKYPEDPAPIISQGIWEGVIAHQPQGHNGFGFDPIFYLPKKQCTVAELSSEEKNQLSHRHQAMQGLLQQLKNM